MYAVIVCCCLLASVVTNMAVNVLKPASYSEEVTTYSYKLLSRLLSLT